MDTVHIHIISPTPDDLCNDLRRLYDDAFCITSARMPRFTELHPEMMKNIDMFHYLLNAKMLILSHTEEDLDQDDLWKRILFLLHFRIYELPARGYEGYKMIIISEKSHVNKIPPVLPGYPVQSSELYNDL